MKSAAVRSVAALVCGTLFGLGLAIAEMTNPNKVLNFLNIRGDWDPSLALTLLGAVLVTSIGYRLVLRRGPIFADVLHLPARTDIDGRLLAGAAIFGIGWGLAGYCPGPALTGLASGVADPVILVVAMIVGSRVAGILTRS